jgi:isopenicillin-N epimerase
VRLPDHFDCVGLKNRLWDECRFEVPVYRGNDVPLLRVSLQGYNTAADTDTLVEALSTLL